MSQEMDVFTATVSTSSPTKCMAAAELSLSAIQGIRHVTEPQSKVLCLQE
jgi:hypothetical protein